MKITSLTIHIIVSTKKGGADKQSFFVTLDETGYINRFRRILSRRTRDKAIVFALSKGRIVDPDKTREPVRLKLTRDNTFWDLMK